MEAPLKQSSSFGRVSSIDVSQLDKINAIPNKTTDNILMDGLCPEDQLYLNALMDYDSSEPDDEGDQSHRSSTWSPMIQSPVIMNKRVKKMKPTYAITLSLEDMSYIRPSWGISKGIRTIEINKKKIKKLSEEKQQEGKAIKKERNEKSSSTNESASYYYFLILLILVVLFLTVPTYIVDKKKAQNRIVKNKISVSSSSKIIEIYKPTYGELLKPILTIEFGRGIPRDLKPEECTCEIYSDETGRYDLNGGENFDGSNNTTCCFACLDWAVRTNLRILVDQQPSDEFSESFCYNIKWQSYDTLLTPLVDCFILGDEQWLGLGDIHAPQWPLNKLQFNDWTPLTTNLTSEFSHYDNIAKTDMINTIHQLPLGSFVNFSLISTNGIYIGNMRTDFEISLKISQDNRDKNSARKMCISAACTDKCTSTWMRSDHLNQLRYYNNILEYSVCSSNNLKHLLSRQIHARSHLVANQVKKYVESSEEIALTVPNSSSSSTQPMIMMSERLVEKEQSKLDGPTMTSSNSSKQLFALESDLKMTNETTNINEHSSSLPDGIGLIDRTIFSTSLEFMPVLDGQTLRHYVDSIVKLGLKTSSILLIDTRWETYVGSLKLNINLFPKSKVLFEILHNKGFKIVFTIKPYIDTGIGISNINQLFESGKLYSASYRKDTQVHLLGAQQKESISERATIIRRKSLFTFQNQSIEIGLNDTLKFPYLTKCKESLEGYCAILDLTQTTTRAWLISSIRRSNLLITEADGIQIGGAHPNSFYWDDHYRSGVSDLVQNLFYKERLYTLPQWTGDFGYIQLAPRRCNWDGLRSIINSILNLGTIGFSLIHPGSVWGDLKTTLNSASNSAELANGMGGKLAPNRMESIYKEVEPDEKSNEELMIRWLQVSMFLPILQFNNIEPIGRHNLQELVQNLVRIRKLFVVPELKKNLPYTPLISQSNLNSTNQLPLIRPVWYNQESGESSIISEQFTIGPDLLVAPILVEGLRQRDIYLPSGFWHDELRQINLRGSKWLRNYPVELNEIAWFTRTRRR